MASSLKTPAQILAELGRQVKELRLRKNYTQAEVASKAGIARSALINLEASGASSSNTLVSVLHALDATAPLESIAPSIGTSPIQLARLPEGRKRARRPRPPSP